MSHGIDWLVPVKELFDFLVESHTVLGPALDDVADRLAKITNYAAMVAVVESYLLPQLLGT